SNGAEFKGRSSLDLSPIGESACGAPETGIRVVPLIIDLRPALELVHAGAAVRTTDDRPVAVEVLNLNSGLVQDLLDGPEAIAVIRETHDLVDGARFVAV